ncbi:hypothetical protein AYL99_08171 [Fonsecaea erecta]|uniref:DNA-directed RNA polymerase III subunit RPC4 n=1 Tax=Fonsecaea erecta TaxID=1367422 RepID=A0A178ZE39_9EURO|nr:hypothetical protein AYL99_08171 [Fonsecaea erecta]OAP57433.1 hypothetical protein AYL99_08171 [Fonsecaea erecta]
MPDETPATPATTNARSTPRGGAARPRPRAGIQRKTKAEREQFAKEEAERQKARAAEQGGSNRGTRGGRGISRGGRGGTAAGQRDEPVAGGGVFGAGSGTRLPTKSRTSYEGYGELLEGGVRGAEDGLQDASASGRGAATGHNGSGAAGTSAGGKGGSSRTAGDLVMTMDDEVDHGHKRDIERIMISSDEDDEDIVTSTSRKGKQKITGDTKQVPGRGLALRPVRAPRTVKVEEGQEGDPARLRSKKSRTAAGLKVDAETQELDSKSEQDEDTEEVDSESLQFIKEQPSSPEMRKRTLKKQLAAGKVGREVKGPVTETGEERAERLRAMEDVQKLRHSFVPAPATDTKMKVDEEDESAPTREAMDRLHDGQFFLFQLPPLTPFLVDSATTHTGEPRVKIEPTTAVSLDALEEHTAGAANTTIGPEIKADPDAPAKATKPDLQMDGLLTALEPTRLPAGIVGKLRVHRSGKVTLDWGGTDMEVRYGAEVDFLQDVVLVEPGQKPEEVTQGGNGEGEDQNGDVIGGGSGGGDGDDETAQKEKKDIKGTAYALGPVRRKMVLIPDWVKLYD